MKEITYLERDALEMGLAERLADDLLKALSQKDRVTFAVAGGTTPVPVYEFLSAVSLDWARVDIVLTDERWVPESNAQSNASMIKSCLLQDKASAAKFHPIYHEGDRDSAIRRAAIDVGPLLPIDVVLLGMGQDMHTASLFPQDPALALAFEQTGQIFVAATAPNGDARVSMGAATLNSAAHKHLLIVGNAKKQAFEDAKKINDPFAAPIMAVAHGLTVHWAK